MPGYVYHMRPASNQRFCKIGMTNGRRATERAKELNSTSYAGFSDWEVISEILVEDPAEVECSFHKQFLGSKVPIGGEQEVFLVEESDVENSFLRYQTIPIAKHIDTTRQYQEEIARLKYQLDECGRAQEKQLANFEEEFAKMKHKNEMLVKENNKLREGELSRQKARRIVKMLHTYEQRFGKLE